MRLFLLTYDRRRGQLLGIDEFEPGEYVRANTALLAKELAHPDLEVVLLEAVSQDQLRLSHRRYFEGPILLAS